MTTDITELAQREKFEAWVMTQICISKSTLEGLRTSDGYRNSTLSGRDYNLMWNLWKAAGSELVDALEKSESRLHEVAVACATAEQALEKVQQRIAKLESNEIREEGNQFLVVRHPGKVPVIKHPVGELEDYLRQIFKADPLATIDIVTHRYYGVGGQFVKDADEYLHEMSVKVEAE
ncbi:TPA: hypothetical protein ACSC6H_001661 [Klebsiella variicola]